MKVCELICLVEGKHANEVSDDEKSCLLAVGAVFIVLE